MVDVANDQDPIDPIVDILIPAYDAEATIEASIGSIQAQSLGDIRIVVVDDGSTDGTSDILARIALADHRVVVISTVNRGIVDALNEGLTFCRAEFVARHDADDLAFPDRLALQVRFLREHPDVVAVGGNAWHIDGTGRRNGNATTFSGDVTGDPFFVPSVEPYLMHPFLTVRRSALLTAGGYRYVFHAEDTDLYWRLMSQGRLHNLPQIIGEYRVHSGSISGQSVINGRVSAIHSQLASISEVRRRDGNEDLIFEKRLLQECEQAGSFGRMIHIASRGLTNDEDAYLRISASIKLLELSSYRPYRLDQEDFDFIRDSIAKYLFRLSGSNRRQIVFRSVIAKRWKIKRYREIQRVLPIRVILRASLDLGVFLVRRRFRQMFARSE